MLTLRKPKKEVILHCYRDCSEIPIYNFNRAKTTGDLRYIIIGWDGRSDVKLPKEANENWNDIKNEWIELLDDNTISYYYDLILEVIYLQTRYNLVSEYIKQIATRDMDMETMEKYVELLAGWRYKYNRKNLKRVEIERLMQQLKSSQNKIGLKLDEIEKLKKDNGYDEAPQSLEKQAVILEQITGKNSIDVMTTSVKKWLEIGKMANDINEQRRRNGSK